MTTERRAALLAGVYYLITFAASIPALLLLGPLLSNPGFVLGEGSATMVTTGAVLDLVNAAACVATAVALYPSLRRVGPARALGFVTSRVLEAAIIAVGVACVLAVLTLRSVGSDADPASLTLAARTLVAVRNQTFLLGPGLMPAVNAVLLGSLLYRSGLVPRVIPLIGLVGAPLQLASVLTTIYGLNTQVSTWSGLAALPIAAWELSLGVWLVVGGLRERSGERRG